MSRWFPAIPFFAVLLAVLVWAANRHATLNGRYYASAVTNGLQSFYAELIKPNTNLVRLTPDTIVLALLSNQSRHSVLLNGVSNPTNIYIETEPTQIGKTNLICVVRTGERIFYGLGANGICRRVTEAELQSWPHAVLSDNERLR